MMKYVTRFDASGRKSEEESYFKPGGEVSEKTLYQYNPGNTVEETQYSYSRDNPNRITFKSVVLYDSAHRMLSLKAAHTDRPADDYDVSIQYDPAGNIIEYTRKTPQGLDLEQSYRNDYEYDKEGNWTRRVTSSPNREFRRSVLRHIEYYPAAAAP